MKTTTLYCILVSVFATLIYSFSFFNFNATGVGHTKISLSVGPNGDARASIPINIPKGTILQPSISLSYNSQGGNGLLGLGWNLNGVLQTITRVPATTAQDGFIDGVDFDTLDRFALNGERLIVRSGIYGGNGSVYSTEQANFSKIISYGNVGSGPQHFIVWTKDGLILEFGVEEDSRIKVANSPDRVIIWLLNKISDTNGNYVEINYFNGATNGEFHPTSIEYTGNQNTGQVPYNRVEFYYEDRPDAFPKYMAGSHSRTTKRLKNIVAYDHQTFFRRYELEYISGVGVSKLHKVTEFGSDNNTHFEPITVNWITNTAGAYDFNKIGTGFWTGHSGGTNNNVSGDFNGDGRTDLARHIVDDQWEVSLANGDSTSTGTRFVNEIWLGGHSGGTQNNVTGDFNGDGRTDLAGFNQALGKWHVSLSTGSGFNSALWQGHIGGIQNNVMGDFNGDGRTDLAGFDPDSEEWHVSLSTGSGFNSSFWIGHIGGAQNNVSGDFNGDGRTDLAGYAGNGDWHVTLSTGSSFSDGGFWAGHSGGAQNNIAGDFNGDGLTDLAGYAGNGEWHVTLSTGTEFVGGFWNGHSGGHQNNIIGDFNGDGRTDLAGYDAVLNKWHVTLSNGNGFSGEFWDGHAGGTQNNVIGDFDGNGMTDILGYAGDSTWHVALSNAKKELVTNIVHNNNQVTVFEYQPIVNTSTYTKGNNAVYPMMDVVGAFYVVSKFRLDNGIGGRKIREYRYFDGKLDHRGRGFRGFGKIEMIDSVANSHVTTIYDRDFKHIAANVDLVTYKTLDGTLIKSVDNTIEAISPYDSVYFSYYATTIERDYDLACAELYNTKTTDFFHDLHGNTINIIEDYNGIYTATTINEFINDEVNWHLGRLTEATVEKSYTGQSPLSKTSSFEYDANGNLFKETLLPSSPSNKLITTYTLDAYGNRIEIEQSGPGIATRSDFYTYDSDGRNIISESNALGHTLNYTYTLGYLQTSQDANGLTTTFTRDIFGRETMVDFPDNTWKSTTYNNCGTCPTGAEYFIETQSSGTGYSKTYFDKLDREIKSTTESFDGTEIHKDVVYNSDGTVNASSDPYYDGQNIYWTVYEYDGIKRVSRETRPGDEVTTFAYHNFETTVINSEGQTFKRVKDPMGNVVSTTDHYGSTLSFEYDNDLNLTKRINTNGNEINYTYDERGFRIAMNDPNIGIYTYEYNTLGQLIEQSYPSGDVVQFEYDLLNRITKRTELEGITEWTYDPPNSIGSVASTLVDGVVSESYQYDNLAKLQSKSYVRNGQNKTFSYTYDVNGFVSSETYPNNYKVHYEYNPRGYPDKVIEDGTNVELWKADQYDENGTITQFTLGNGIKTQRTYDDATGDLQGITSGPTNALSSIQDLTFSFSKVGNLKQRRDLNLELTENFEFDNLNRLTKSTVTGQLPLEVQYDALGNIIYKSDVGTYNYGLGANGPNILTSIDHSSVPGCGYNLNHAVTYTSYNYVSSIDNGTKKVEIDYGPERDRHQIRTYESGQLAMTKTFVGSTYEEIEDATSGETTLVCYLKIGSEVFAYTSKEGTAPQEITYIHTDHLGSVNALTMQSGLLDRRFSYDAWGKERDQTTWENLQTPVEVPPFAKGFTFHEMLDLDWLVFMNARVYNPVLGRFLSPDSFIQFGENMQSLNRFAYVLNNPLSLTDPTGHFSFGEFLEDTIDFVKENAGAIVGIAIGIATGGAGGFLAQALGSFWGAVASGAAAGFGAAFTDALLAGASFSDAFDVGLDGGLWGAISAGITQRIGKLDIFSESNLTSNKSLYGLKAAIHGVAQGGIAEARGGDFKSGFIGAAVAELGIDAVDGLGFGNSVVVGAVVGGTSSHLSGGKFANGAMSGAFIAIYNHGIESIGDDYFARELRIWEEAFRDIPYKLAKFFEGAGPSIGLLKYKRMIKTKKGSFGVEFGGPSVTFSYNMEDRKFVSNIDHQLISIKLSYGPEELFFEYSDGFRSGIRELSVGDNVEISFMQPVGYGISLGGRIPINY